MSSADHVPPGLEEEGGGGWILQHLGPKGLRVGALLAETEHGVRVRFGTGETVDWPALPKSVRHVERGSVAWRAAQDRDQLLDQLGTRPGDVLADIAREAGRPFASDDFQARLIWLQLVEDPTRRPGDSGVPGRQPLAWKDVWKKGRTGLVQHPHVAVDATSRAFSWSDEALEKAGTTTTRASSSTTTRRRNEPDIERLLVRLTAQLRDAVQQQAARDEIRRLAADGRLEPMHRAVAVAAGALIGEAIDWSAVADPSSVPESAVDTLVTYAARQRAWDFLVRAAGDPSSPRVARNAASHLKAADDPAAAEAIGAHLDGLAAAAARTPPAELAGRVGAITAAVARPTPAPVARAALGLLARLPSSADPERDLPTGTGDATAADLLALATEATPAELQAAVAELGDSQVDAVVRSSVAEPFDAQGPRSRILDAIAAVRPGRFGALGTGPWLGLDAEVLPELCRLPALGPLLCGGDPQLLATVTVPAIEAAVAAGELAELLAMTAWPGPLRAIVPPGSWAAGVRRAASREPGGELLHAAFEAVAGGTPIEPAPRAALDEGWEGIAIEQAAEIDRLKARLAELEG